MPTDDRLSSQLPSDLTCIQDQSLREMGQVPAPALWCKYISTRTLTMGHQPSNKPHCLRAASNRPRRSMVLRLCIRIVRTNFLSKQCAYEEVCIICYGDECYTSKRKKIVSKFPENDIFQTDFCCDICLRQLRRLHTTVESPVRSVARRIFAIIFADF